MHPREKLIRGNGDTQLKSAQLAHFRSCPGIVAKHALPVKTSAQLPDVVRRVRVLELSRPATSPAPRNTPSGLGATAEAEQTRRKTAAAKSLVMPQFKRESEGYFTTMLMIRPGT